MDLSRISIVLRSRTAWEAIDLGFAMGRRWFWSLWLLWWCGALPVYVAAAVLLPETEWLVPALVAWWCKPLYEPPLLYWASRAMFGDAPDRREMLRQWPRVAGPRLISNLTWRRFDPLRSFRMAVTVLEGLRGRRYRDRVLLLGRNQHAAAWLTVFGLLFETIIELSVIVLIIMMIPETLRWSDVWTLAFGSSDFTLVLGELAAMLGMSLMAPFYVSAGFSLYINRRSVLEGWDIELGFRRIAARHGNRAPRSSAGALSSAVAALATGVVVLGLLPGDTMAGRVPDRQTASTMIEEVLAEPDFGRERTDTYWHYVGGDEDPDDDKWQWGLLGEFFEWLFDVVAGFLKGAAAVAEVLLWAAAGFAVAFVIAWVMKQRTWPRLNARRTDQGNETGFRLFNLDVSPAALPADIPAAARALADTGEVRGALSLLYRGMLARFIREKRPDIAPGATEGECLALVRSTRTSAESDYFGRLTRAWIRLAYAHQPPKPAAVQALCAQWREANHDAGS